MRSRKHRAADVAIALSTCSDSSDCAARVVQGSQKCSSRQEELHILATAVNTWTNRSPSVQALLRAGGEGRWRGRRLADSGEWAVCRITRQKL